MADDIQPISGTDAAVALRLCNFETAKENLLPTHVQALDDSVAPVVRGLVGPWVDLFGYASRKGDAEFNQALSRRRLESVRAQIGSYATNVNFQLQTALGASESTGGPDDNDGYWRAVEVYVYATRPAHIEPHVDPGSTRFEIRVVGGGSASIGLATDDYFFQIVDLDKQQTAFFLYTGAGFSISVPKIPGPGSLSYSGPPAPFTTSIAVELHQFNSKATLTQDPGITIGPLSVGGTFRLSIDEILDAGGSLAATRPSPIPIEGGSGIQMPGIISVTEGVFALASDVFPFTGY